MQWRTARCTDLSTAADSASEPTEWHTLLVSDHIFQVCNSTTKMHTLDGLSCFAGVLHKTVIQMSTDK